MDITPQDNTTQQAISDDQELAKALAGVMPDAPEPAPGSDTSSTPAPDSPLQFEETPVATAPAVADDADAPAAEPTTLPQPTEVPEAAPSSDLDTIKKDALGELRPLIDKVDLPAEEKFDTYLMMIRTTDDATLVGPAHSAAQGIADEKRRAEALLEIIKEIDYLSHKDQAQ